jgi:uncharacterized RDD family membrane protein YckC
MPAASMTQAAPAVERSPPTLWHRVAAMIYELVLLFGVVFVVSWVLLTALRWTYPLAPAQRWVLQAVLFVAIGVYFAYCWSRGGQTLAMKSWGLRLESPARPLGFGRAFLRYVLAWHLLLPSLLLVALFQLHALIDLVLFAGAFAVMLLTLYLDPGRQYLHDRWLGTRVVKALPR